MRRFVGPSYDLQHRKADVQSSKNLYPVVAELPGGKAVVYLDQVPGLTAFSTDVSDIDCLLMETGDFLLQEDTGKIVLDV